MNTTFFQDLENLLTDGCLQIVVQKGVEETLIVSILPINHNVGDTAKNVITPLVFKGKAAEIDNTFIQSIQEPIKATNLLFSNMEGYLKQVEEAKVKSQMEADKVKAEKTAKDERKKKFDTLIKKVEELENEKKFKEAIEQLFKATDLIEHAEEIKKRISELQAKSQPTMF